MKMNLDTFKGFILQSCSVNHAGIAKSELKENTLWVFVFFVYSHKSLASTSLQIINYINSLSNLIPNSVNAANTNEYKSCIFRYLYFRIQV